MGQIGTEANGWHEAALDELVEAYYSGGTPSTANPAFWNGTTPWITGADIVDQKVTAPRRFLSQDGVNSGQTQVVPAGSVLIVTRTGVGKVAIAPFDVAVSQDLTAIAPKRDHLSTEYLYWWLASDPARLLRLRQGTSINGILREDLGALRLVLPPLGQQNAVTVTLATIDHAAIQTEALIKATDQLRDALLQDLMTRGIPNWHREWKEEAGAGAMPACWDVVPLGRVLKRTQYGTNISLTDNPKGVAVLRMSNLQNGELDFQALK
jgi:type I restriction enzyme S subunit